MIQGFDFVASVVALRDQLPCFG